MGVTTLPLYESAMMSGIVTLDGLLNVSPETLHRARKQGGSRVRTQDQERERETPAWCVASTCINASSYKMVKEESGMSLVRLTMAVVLVASSNTGTSTWLSARGTAPAAAKAQRAKQRRAATTRVAAFMMEGERERGAQAARAGEKEEEIGAAD